MLFVEEIWNQIVSFLSDNDICKKQLNITASTAALKSFQLFERNNVIVSRKIATDMLKTVF